MRDIGASGDDTGFERHGQRRAGRECGARTAPRLFDRLLLPIASEGGAEAAWTALRPNVDTSGTRFVNMSFVEEILAGDVAERLLTTGRRPGVVLPRSDADRRWTALR